MVQGYDYRPEISGNGMNTDKVNSYNVAQMDLFKNKVFLENRNKVKLDNNEFMNLTMVDIYNNIMNLIPNLYNDYHKKYLEVSLKNTDKYLYSIRSNHTGDVCQETSETSVPYLSSAAFLKITHS